MGAKIDRGLSRKLGVNRFVLTGLLLALVTASFEGSMSLSQHNADSKQVSIEVDDQGYTIVNCWCDQFRDQQLSGWIGKTDIRATVVEPDAAHPGAQLLLCHLRSSSGVTKTKK